MSSASTTTGLRNLRDLSFADLEAWALERGYKKFLARQLYEWLYVHGATDFAQMTNVAKAAREALTREFTLALPECVLEQRSIDGTTKYLFQFADGKTIESVWIPVIREQSRARHTLCISTQAGCAMGCKFCHTAMLGLLRNLTPGEILGQIQAAKARLPENGSFTNIVMMGMGEPLHNYDNVMQATRIMIDPHGLKIGKRHVTLSTVGLVPGILKFAQEKIGIKLALSLHATTDEQRQKIMPMGRKYSIDEVLQACHEYCRVQGGRARVTFEYLLLHGVNDTREDAKRLVQLASRVPSKVNVIPWNPYPGAPWERPTDEQIHAFTKLLRDKNVQVNIRVSRGRDIAAACGQLAGEKRDKRLSLRGAEGDEAISQQ